MGLSVLSMHDSENVSLTLKRQALSVKKDVFIERNYRNNSNIKFVRFIILFLLLENMSLLESSKLLSFAVHRRQFNHVAFKIDEKHQQWYRFVGV